MTTEQSLKDLQTIPGVGKSIAQDLYQQGFCSVKDLKNQDPEKMYQKQCRIQEVQIDRCLLYTFRCAIYFASSTKHDPKLLKWWNWKDKK